MLLLRSILGVPRLDALVATQIIDSKAGSNCYCIKEGCRCTVLYKKYKKYNQSEEEMAHPRRRKSVLCVRCVS